MREILFLVHRIPYPPDKGDKIRSWHFLSHLVGHCKVHLGCFVDDDDDLVEHAPVLRDLCGESYFARIRPWVARARSLAATASSEPVSLGAPSARAGLAVVWTSVTDMAYASAGANR